MDWVTGNSAVWPHNRRQLGWSEILTLVTTTSTVLIEVTMPCTSQSDSPPPSPPRVWEPQYTHRLKPDQLAGAVPDLSGT